jgi:DNA helicase II / ATP-dependent DNA helicase PcrA
VTAFPWTDEQKAVLVSTDRITLVQAGPGSGKTKVFAELVDARLKVWPHQVGGLAALSFTNVARAEIEDRVCASTVAPHFVGTLDAFFLRFVVGPFGHLAGLPKSGARLIPSPLDQQIAEPSVKLGEKLFASIFQITATAGTEAAPQFQFRAPNGLPARPVPPHLIASVLNQKQKEWKSRGRVTHGDCSYLASCILHGPHGPIVRAMLARRFPLICIDEFQDTGHFLGRAVLSLLAEPNIHAIVVGDINQKIFGFSGVNPNLFEQVDKLAGAKKYPLETSQRCATRVCSVASLLSRSGASVLPAKEAKPGRTALAKHNDKPSDLGLNVLDAAFVAARQSDCRDVAVLVRKRVTKAAFIRTATKGGPLMNCRGVTQIVRALDAIKESKGRSAGDIAEALVCRIMFGDDRPSEEELLEAGVEPSGLRRHVRRLLLDVIDVKPPETWGQWTSRVKGLCDGIAAAYGVTTHKARLGGAFKANKDDKPDEVRKGDTPLVFDWPGDLDIEVLTVHEAKGREFDAVFFYCPQPRKVAGASTCPSEAWWAAPEVAEEREVAFVATTRAKRLLVLAVHEKTWTALSQTRKDFFGLFEPLPDGAEVAAKPKV